MIEKIKTIECGKRGTSRGPYDMDLSLGGIFTVTWGQKKSVDIFHFS